MTDRYSIGGDEEGRGRYTWKSTRHRRRNEGRMIILPEGLSAHRKGENIRFICLQMLDKSLNHSLGEMSELTDSPWLDTSIGMSFSSTSRPAK